MYQVQVWRKKHGVVLRMFYLVSTLLKNACTCHSAKVQTKAGESYNKT